MVERGISQQVVNSAWKSPGKYCLGLEIFKQVIGSMRKKDFNPIQNLK